MKPHMVLNLLGVEFEAKRVDLQKGEHKSEEYKKVSVTGKVPSFQDGNVNLVESGAIVYYILEKFDKEKKHTPAPGTPLNAIMHQVIGYSVTAEHSLEKAIVEAIFKGGFGEEGKGDKAAFDAAAKEFHEVHEPVYEAWLGDNEYFNGSTLGVADAFAGYLMGFASIPKLGVGIQSEKLKAYFARVSSSDVFKKAIEGSFL
eukprot:CAMPEP_0201475214 /NCGR_PEP_ID=MMETSP0151_2-20130828/668_1 /ASSEMBLY_ACC=CAM_ASM_000257 /TAXON_ID=200890 /ORGANISM="Paramoeba atlantica, Strain 621/1 / CCAP 1560/9" /LENGTH=200 /DNA_ID=CAMNT_0047855247 /DNA_START=130 /DNA_END=732 /DNA_ORIENTATION=+